MTKIDQILKTLTSRVGVIKVNSALNPLLWLTGVVTPIGLLASLFAPAEMRVVVAVLAGVPVIATVLAYFVLLFRDPDRLQSEEYQLKQLEMTQILRKGQDGPILLDNEPPVRPERKQTGPE